MDPILADVLAPLFALVGVAGAVLTGMKMRYNYLAKIKTAEPSEDVQRLTDAVETLNENMQLLRDEMLELQERVTFAERLLSKGSDGDAPR